MSPRARVAKTSASSPISPSTPKKKSVSIQKPIRNVVQKKSSPTIQPRQKRLSSLTATTLLQYCTSILSPSRRLKSTSTSLDKKIKVTKQSPINNKTIQSTPSRKRQISNVSETKSTQTDLHIPVRARREASSHASAMIMQQNEFERSRYNCSRAKEQSTSAIRRHRTKSTNINKNDIPSEPFKFNIPPIPPLPAPAPSIAGVSNHTEDTQSSIAVTTWSSQSLSSTITSTNSKYPFLTEAILAEHDRLHKIIPSHQTTKHDNLRKWTQELALYGRLSPPYPEHENPIESIHSDSSTTNSKSASVASHIDTTEITLSSMADSKPLDSLPINASSSSALDYSTTANHDSTPTFLFPSSAYPLDLRSFYPLLPCWQYPTWPFQSSAYPIPPASSVNHPETKTKKTNSIISIHKQNKDPLTFHLHTHHHHHHIHNSNSTCSLKSLNSTTIPLSSQKSSTSVNKKQRIETKIILSSNVNKKEDQQISSTIKKTTRRKSSPVKRLRTSRTKSNSSLIGYKVLRPINSLNQVPVSTILKSNNHSPVGDEKSSRRVLKHRSVSAAVANSTRIPSIAGKSLRGKRTISATNRKRSYSPSSITLPLLNNKNVNQRKKRKILHDWILFGKSEQKLVLIHSDKPPVFRECYSSIQHTTEKDIINSNDCVLLRSETAKRYSFTPYLAKVKWFWEEPTTGEIQMSILWYYHPEHTDLAIHIKEQFLRHELLASKYWDCVSAACIEDKCYVLTLNEYNRYRLREKSVKFFENSEPVGQLKLLLNKNTSIIHHRSLPAKTVGNQNIFFCRYVYDYRVNRILNNPNSVITASSM